METPFDLGVFCKIKSMKIEDKKIAEIIFNKNANRIKFIIPDYQRSYVWGEQNIEEFWKDINDSEGEKLSFLGSFIFQSEDDTDEYYNIVDGQQRVITMCILLSVLRNISKEIKEEGLATSINERMVEMDERKKEPKGFFLNCWEEVQPFLEKYIFISNGSSIENEIIQKKDITKYNIKNNYIFLYDLVKKDLGIEKNIDEIEDVEGIVKKIERVLKNLDDLRIVYIKVNNDEEAYTAFEVVNARGQELGNIDLLKNLFYKEAFKEGRKKEMVQIWEKIINNIKSHKLESFLKHFWHSYYGRSEFVTSKKLYKSIKKNIENENNKETPFSFAEKMLNDSEIYKTFADLENYDWIGYGDKYNKKNQEILKSLKVLKKFNITQAYIFLLSLIRNRERLGERRIRNLINYIEKFHFIYSAISKLPGNRVEKIYAKHAEDLNTACINGNDSEINKIYDNIQNSLKLILPSEEEFKNKAIAISYNSKDLVRYVFNEIEISLSSNEKVIDFLSSNIEHINAQNGIEDIGNKYMDNIGNLVILGGDLNSGAGNKLVKEKIDKYQESKLKIVEELIGQIKDSNGEWKEEDIVKRAQNISEKICNISYSVFSK